jgi:hypothetical protein
MDWNAITAISPLLETIIILITAIFVLFQLKEMKRATIAQAFFVIVSYLQTPECREARKVLIKLNEKDFTKWTDEQIKNAGIACSTYDGVGILIRKKVIDHRMVTVEYRNSIICCWEHARPMIESYREERGNDFWDDFEWLYENAKKHSNGI